MKRLGVSYSDAHKINPGIIYIFRFPDTGMTVHAATTPGTT